MTARRDGPFTEDIKVTRIDFRFFKTVRVENEVHDRIKKAQEVLQRETKIPLTPDAVAAQLIAIGLQTFNSVHGVEV